MARASFPIDKPGEVQINVVSEPALSSVVLQLDASNEAAAVTVVVPTVSVTPQIATPTVTVVPQNDLISQDGHPRIGVGSEPNHYSTLGLALGSLYLCRWLIGI
jgi:hypothetical protein